MVNHKTKGPKDNGAEQAGWRVADLGRNGNATKISFGWIDKGALIFLEFFFGKPYLVIMSRLLDDKVADLPGVFPLARPSGSGLGDRTEAGSAISIFFTSWMLYTRMYAIQEFLDTRWRSGLGIAISA